MTDAVSKLTEGFEDADGKVIGQGMTEVNDQGIDMNEVNTLTKEFLNAGSAVMYEGLIEDLRGQFENGHPEFIARMVNLLDLHDGKNHDYAKGGDALGNFKRVASLLSNYPGLDLSKPAVVAFVYALKQIDAVLWMLSQGHEAVVEGVSERLDDISVYMQLVALLLGEE